MVAIANECGPLSEVGTSVVPIYGRHPLALAAQARTAQDVLDGRFTLGIGPSHAVAVTDKPDEARAAAIEGGAGYASLPAYRAMLDREGVENGGELGLFGSMDEVAEGFRRYVDAGATELRIAVAAPDEATDQRSRDAIAEWIASS